MQPFLISLLEPLGETGSRVVTGWVVEFVNNVQIGVLGVLGFVVLFYFVLSLVGKIEDALNYMWRVPRGRPLVRRFTDYLSVVLVGPTLIFTAFTLIAAARRSWFVQGLLEGMAVRGSVSILLSWLVPLLVLFGVFTFVYKFLPNTPVRLRSALLGGATASLFWVLAGASFTVFVAEAPDRVAIYRSFAAATRLFRVAVRELVHHSGRRPRRLCPPARRHPVCPAGAPPARRPGAAPACPVSPDVVDPPASRPRPTLPVCRSGDTLTGGGGGT